MGRNQRFIPSIRVLDRPEERRKVDPGIEPLEIAGHLHAQRVAEFVRRRFQIICSHFLVDVRVRRRRSGRGTGERLRRVGELLLDLAGPDRCQKGLVLLQRVVNRLKQDRQVDGGVQRLEGVAHIHPQRIAQPWHAFLHTLRRHFLSAGSRHRRAQERDEHERCRDRPVHPPFLSRAHMCVGSWQMIIPETRVEVQIQLALSFRDVRSRTHETMGARDPRKARS